jgi:hypothetical protein
MAERSIAYVVGFLTLAAFFLGLAHRQHVLRASRVDGGRDRRRWSMRGSLR